MGWPNLSSTGISRVPSPTGSAKRLGGVVERHLAKGRGMGVAGRRQRRLVDLKANRAKGEAIVTDGESREDGAGLECFP